tara:strand:+ start:256 stop:606 length:351 start_codon:yes stop_codon:yes gene_type:complete
MFNFLKKILKKQYPEDLFKITITENLVKIEHPTRKTEQINWDDIEEIKLINTDTGPVEPDVWLALLGKDSGCLIPHGSNGYEDIYNTVSQYDKFNFENVIESMTCVENKEFLLWIK